jgi:hypothetical protein
MQSRKCENRESMRKELTLQILFYLVYFLLIILIKGWFSLSYLPFWFGGLIGLFLPYADQLIYIYFLKPNDPVSSNLKLLIAKGKYRKVSEIFVGNSGAVTRAILHTAHFQIIFLLLTIFVITSSGSIFGVGLVLAFFLHLFVTQLRDFMNMGNIHLWFSKIGISMDRKGQIWYVAANGVVLLLIGLLL